MIKQTDQGVIVNIKISPNAKKNEIINEGEISKIKITAQPIDGKANKCLIEYLSKEFKIPKTYIKILKGETSKEKTILFMVNDEEKVILLNKTFGT
ncbi:MAG: YggU family protein [Cyanobacteria bacterium SIG26]|nr:YggU family protein [Cyanobacteria bacterium SIG26]